MLKLDGIASFVAVAESGSISEAGRRLNLSKSVVSERLAELERMLGTRLLHRTTRKVSLTEDGAAFLQQATRIIRDVEAATADMAERRGGLTGPLRISAPVTFGRMHLGPALYPFIAAHPQLEVTLDLNDRRIDASSEGFDAVIRHGPLQDSRLVAWQLATSQRLLVASPTYLEQYGRPASVDDLPNHKGIFYTNRGTADWRFDGQHGARIARAKNAFRVNNGDMMLDATLAGLGIALLPTFIAGAAIRSGALHVVDIGLSTATEYIYVAHPEGRHASAKLRALVDCLKLAFGSPPYWDNQS
ncbi:LysR family transcriptional regulator [Pseudomonas sp. MS19]|uniref:LysR family transcriptional regulator n=1 Tax=Pseudomonas sp. MS19 TaxID=2579939 RepID=UPI00156233ED|nr:LysR family transcriptional regulator [Pseudomonas sp. MS19]NRH28555.1 LysR family transcriptional regulator [Pseudomonas sp. MS19]